MLSPPVFAPPLDALPPEAAPPPVLTAPDPPRPPVCAAACASDEALSQARETSAARAHGRADRNKLMHDECSPPPASVTKSTIAKVECADLGEPKLVAS